MEVCKGQINQSTREVLLMLILNWELFPFHFKIEMLHDQHILFSLGKSEDIPVEETKSETSKDAPQRTAIFAIVPKRPQTKLAKNSNWTRQTPCVFIYSTSCPTSLKQHYQNNETEGPARMTSAKKAFSSQLWNVLIRFTCLSLTLQNTRGMKTS